MSPEALRHAQTIFAFHQLNHRPVPADAMIVLGTNDTRVAGFAADLYHRGLSPLIVVTGGIAHQNDLLATGWDRPESEIFAALLAERGVPYDNLLLESEAANTGENIAFSRRILTTAEYHPRSVLIVVKPFMQRRAFATHAVEWPEVPATVASWETTFEEYCTADLPPAKVANIIMGDLQRIWLYARRGYSAPQRIPAEVRSAYRRMVELGFTQHLIPDEPDA